MNLAAAAFVIQTHDGRSLLLTEISHMKNVKSENASLLDWVHALHQPQRIQDSATGTAVERCRITDLG